MGCSASKLDEEEAVQLCKDRKNFIKQVIEHRNRFASGHVAYIQSMRRVSLALLQYVVADDLHEFLSDSYTTPPFTPVKELSPEIRAPLKFSTPTTNERMKNSVYTVNYLRSGGIQSVAVEEWLEPHETVQLESYYPMESHGMDGFFVSQSSPVNRASFFSSPWNRSSYQFSSPQTSMWDYFWNPFSSDQFGYSSRSSFDRTVNDDDIAGLRRVREAEGIPELEEDIDDDHDHDHEGGSAVFWKTEPKNETPEVESKHTGVLACDESPVSAHTEVQQVQEVKEFKSKGAQSTEALEDQNAVELKIPTQYLVAANNNAEKTPGFTVYVNRRPSSMAEVMKDMENQFMRICECAHEISVMLFLCRLCRMWKTMADCHLIQKRTIDEGKLLLLSNTTAATAAATQPKPPHSAAHLAAELRNWRFSFANWIDAQRCYARALAGWASRCSPPDPGESSSSCKTLSPISPLRDGGGGEATTSEVVRLCVRWSRLVESVSEERVVDGMDFFAAGMASVSARREEGEGMGEGMAALAEVMGPRVLCAGLSVAVGSLAELAVVSAEGYDGLVR